jgi:predicted Zn finger-like uncharacterized protein
VDVRDKRFPESREISNLVGRSRVPGFHFRRLAIPAAAKRLTPGPSAPRREAVVCPNCDKTYQIAADWLGAVGRKVRCKSCTTEWFVTSHEDHDTGTNPVLAPAFPYKMKLYLNGLPEHVKLHSKKSTHAIKSFLIRHGLPRDAIGHANQIKVNMPQHRNTEFLWDVVSKVEHPQHPREDHDLLFVAESENHIHIEKIVEDANKLPIVRADARLMFFRAANETFLETYFERLRELFQRHRKSEIGDVYILAGMDIKSLEYNVRKLTIRRERSNESPWEIF